MTGASVAGPAAALCLSRAGYDVTVVERAAGLRPGGQNVDVRASGRDALRRMGLEDAVKARNTGEVGTRFVDAEGGVVSEFPVDDREGSEGPTAELEILRGALSQVLADACPDSVTWVWDDEVTAVAQDESGVDVTLAGGTTDRFDLLVVAEGVGSRTRGLVFADDEVEERALGMYSAYGTIERTDADDDWWRFYFAAASRQASLRPDDEGTIRANLNWLTDAPDLEDADPRGAMRERFEGAGWEVPRILDGFDATDELYVDWLRQVVCRRWHNGRVVLLGDAAWCVTPIGGGGSSLAIAGAYVLAAYLSQHDDHLVAFAEYEQWLRPVVEDVQDLPPGTPRIAAPKTRAGVALLRLGTRIAALDAVQGLASKITSGPEATRELPELRER